GLLPLPRALLGGSEEVARSLPADARRRGEDADPPDDRRARSAHADRPDGGVLPGAAGARGADDDDPLQRRVPRHRLEAVELHADAALPALLVPALAAGEDRRRRRAAARRVVT